MQKVAVAILGFPSFSVTLTHVLHIAAEVSNQTSGFEEEN